ncbi:MAG: sigma-70 family RNA polymerase sigma factor [Clostridia bacterium]|nr:sigma-70 family RNA polymerase sigma factor [Clostridia bacterium]
MQNTAETVYRESTDEALVCAFQNGDAEAFSELVARYLKLIRIKACSFREIFSLEREDLYQEGLLGLFDAVRSYRVQDGRASFETYAGRCINNRIVSAVRRDASRKNSLLNHAVSIDEISVLDAGQTADPQQLLENQDEMDHMLETVHASLSAFERKVLSLYLSGYKRSEIQTKLGISVRAFDNAMVRVRKKLRQK